jgi:fumarate reductase (CoM/CoB) subunit B
MERYVKQLEYCTYCPKMCRHACPVGGSLGCETLTPQSKMQLLNMMRKTAIPWEPEFVAPIYGCTLCRLCSKYCLHGNTPADALLAGRLAVEKRGLLHPAFERLPERFRERSERLHQKLRREFSGHLFAQDAQVVYFPGCETVDKSIDDIRDAFSIFDSLDLNFIRLADLPYVCFGAPLWAAGFEDQARFVAREMVNALRRFSTVVMGCAACTWLLRQKLLEEGFEHNTEVLHITEYLYVHAERLAIQRTRPAAFYHDPCFLGRRLGILDQPRRLLSRGVGTVKEFFSSRELGECCGGGGLVPHTYPEAARAQARRRLAEAELFGTNLVVTSCPTCKRTLTAAGTDVEVLDLLNLLSWCLAPPDRMALPEEEAG